MKFLFVHGYNSSSQDYFWPWLKDELRQKGHEVISPDLPGGEDPDPDEWVKALLEVMRIVDDETIVIGHSLGAPIALQFLEAVEARSTPRACLLIAPPWRIASEKFIGFFLSELDFDVLMWKSSRFVVLHDKKDETIPFDHAQKYAQMLAAKLIETSGNGHFKGKEYPEVLQVVQSLVDENIEYDPGAELPDAFEGIE
ncbi:alpha/beta fold hydrolase [Patescibacteria group bacterium]|nr:alpha/beta fold hydrolase [Patescibacteria group bacterium]